MGKKRKLLSTVIKEYNRERVVIWVRNNPGYATKAIAEAMHWSVAYVRNLLNSAFQDDLVMFAWGAKHRTKAWWPYESEAGNE